MNILKDDKNQNTKEKILIATINASVKKIRNPYSLCNIAKDVGISKPAIFRYFCCFSTVFLLYLQKTRNYCCVFQKNVL